MIFTKFQKLGNFFTCWKKSQKNKKNKNPAHPPMSSKNSSIHTVMLLSFHPHFLDKISPHPTSINPSYPLDVGLRLTGKENWANHTWFLSKKWGWKERSIIVCIELFLELMGGWPGFLFFFNFWHFFSICEKITQFLEFCKDQGGKI